MVRSLLLTAFLLAAAPAAAIPPLPTEPPAMVPPAYYPPPPVPDGLIFARPPGTARINPRPRDVLGDVWEMWEVSNWTAVWMRRGDGRLFDGYWTHPGGERVRATVEIWVDGDQATVVRRHPDGRYCRYDGRFDRDWVRVNGHYTCTWERTPMPWRAQVVRLDDVTPRLLRRGR